MSQSAIDTQCAQIRVHLESGKSITQAEAIEAWGCYRLGARIFDLRAAGMDIITETGTGKNRYGKQVRHEVHQSLQRRRGGIVGMGALGLAAVDVRRSRPFSGGGACAPLATHPEPGRYDTAWRLAGCSS